MTISKRKSVRIALADPRIDAVGTGPATLARGYRRSHMKLMDFHNFSHRAAGAAAPSSPWQVVPLSGCFEVVYEDARGTWTTRILDARELKLGPGRTLLGGTDRAHGLYRGLRTDRIHRLIDAKTGQRVETGILDWLLARAEAQRRAGQPRSVRRAA